jgi:hypothetical protein
LDSDSLGTLTSNSLVIIYQESVDARLKFVDVDPEFLILLSTGLGMRFSGLSVAVLVVLLIAQFFFESLVTQLGRK